MECFNPVIHTIQAGDTLFSLANKYYTTVEAILALNPEVDVYNLQIGSKLIISCPVTEPVPPIGTLPKPVDVIGELLLLIMCWLREQFGDNPAQQVIQTLCSKLNDLDSLCPAPKKLF